MRLAPASLLVLAACSGAVSGPPTQPVLTPLSVTPAAATAYPGIPTTFTASGGTGNYSVSSTNQAIVPNPAVSSGTFTIIPYSVAAETKLTLAVQDGTSSVNIPVTVEPPATTKLTALPSILAFQGQTQTACAGAIPADVLIFGGVPPYVVSQPAGYTVNPMLVTTYPGRVTVIPTGQCVPPTQLAIIDTVGSSATVTLTNTVSPTLAPTVPDMTAAPLAVTLTACTDIAHVVLLGGSGHYFAASGSNSLYAYVDTSNTAAIYRQHSESTALPLTIPVVFSDGITTQLVTVTLLGTARSSPC